MTPDPKPINIEKLKMKAEYVLLESIRDELRMIRQLMDKSGVFAHMPTIAMSGPVKLVGGPPATKPVEREVAESETKPTQADPLKGVVLNPENIEWESAKGPAGPYERHPFVGQKVQSTPDYHNLRDAILAMHQSGKRGLQHEGMFYWLFTDRATIGRKPAKQFKKR